MLLVKVVHVTVWSPFLTSNYCATPSTFLLLGVSASKGSIWWKFWEVGAGCVYVLLIIQLFFHSFFFFWIAKTVFTSLISFYSFLMMTSASPFMNNQMWRSYCHVLLFHTEIMAMHWYLWFKTRAEPKTSIQNLRKQKQFCAYFFSQT